MIRTREELRDYVSLPIPELAGMGDYRANVAALQTKIATITAQLKGLTFLDPRRRKLQAERGGLQRELLNLQAAQRKEEERIRQEQERIKREKEEALARRRAAVIARVAPPKWRKRARLAPPVPRRRRPTRAAIEAARRAAPRRKLTKQLNVLHRKIRALQTQAAKIEAQLKRVPKLGVGLPAMQRAVAQAKLADFSV